MEWTSTNSKLPKEATTVWTKISDEKGERNEQRMYRQGNLWFCLDGTYVYYAPTHWADISKYNWGY